MSAARPTKGFLEQDHRKPRPGQWSRHHYARTAPNDAHAAASLAPKPPIPPTSQAKSKLHAFQFILAEGDTVDDRQSAPVVHAAPGEEQEKNSSGGVDPADPDAPAVSVPQISRANTCPCTPGARLPLEALIGNCDELEKNPEPEHQSPEEQIAWVPNSSDHRQKRKRAKSSSPSCPNSSSQQDLNWTLPGDNVLPSTTKKTSPADPATALWQQYAGGQLGEDAVNFPGFMFTGSPRPMETPVKSGHLRRWASTGNDWPSSKNKRRCTTRPQGIHVWQDQNPADPSAKSKVAVMVQKIQETLASQQLEQERRKSKSSTGSGSARSSPVLEQASDNAAMVDFNSPLRARHPNLPSGQDLRLTKSENLRSEPVKPVRDPLNPNTTGLYLQSKAPLPAYKRPSVTRLPSQPQVSPAIQQPVAPASDSDLDEFEDDAFDLTADDLENLLSQKATVSTTLHKSPQHSKFSSTPSAQLPSQHNAEQLEHRIESIDDDDEFGCDDIDADSFAQAEFSATQALRTPSPRKRSPKHNRNRRSHSPCASHREVMPRVQRYKVKQVVDGQCIDQRGRQCSERVLEAEHWRSAETIAITLRDSWSCTPVCAHNIVHVVHHPRIAAQTESFGTRPGQLMISDNADSPFLVVHPDHMLSATTVADSFDCIRKAVLQDRIKATGETNKAMVYGKILHEIFQQVLSANQWDQTFLEDLVHKTVQDHVEGLWALGMRDTVLAVEEIKQKSSELSAWANSYVREQPEENSLIDDKQGEKLLMTISKLIAIEEHIWSPRYGLKGNVDATVQTTVVAGPLEPPRKFIVPLELKTGKLSQSPAHQAQTALYTLLISDRYDVFVEAGILHYLESSTTLRIAPPLREIRQMVQQRNRLAAYILRMKRPLQNDDVTPHRTGSKQSQSIEESNLPALLRDPLKCGRCYAQQSCFTYHALQENGSADSAGMIDDKKKNYSLIWKEAVGHLLSSAQSPSHAASMKRWFTKWDRLLTWEEGEQTRTKNELWTMTSEEREALGRCFGGLIIEQDLTDNAASVSRQGLDSVEAVGSSGKINRYTYSFARAASGAGGDFTEGSQLTKGEPVVISSENGQWALANGYLVAVNKREVVVAVDRKLNDSRQRLFDFNEHNNQTFRGTATVGKDDAQISANPFPVLYRLDKDEFSNGLALIRNNLVRLMAASPRETRLRELILSDVKPTFELQSSAPDQLQHTQLGHMNEDQQAAVTKVLSARDYALILGMPGTGKTTTIAHIIHALLAAGKTILLTSFTHTAVDNILLKIRDIVAKNCILRLGVLTKIHAQVQEFCQTAATPCDSIEEIEASYMRTKVVATTCMGTNHPLFSQRTFDVCIVDEASQITLPTILGPLLHTRKFVLVGDHFQLPPLVQNKAALEGGLDVSLFRQLSEEYPGAVATLGKQYRMCQDVMALSNHLIYHGQLRCGDENVAHRTLQLPLTEALRGFHSSSTAHGRCEAPCWIARITDPARKVVYANTDGLGKAAMETLSRGKNITNVLEATVSVQTVLSLLAMGAKPSEIGIITLYRSQLDLIRQLCRKAHVPADVEIDSADRFQGRDKECIILSMVRSNELGAVGDLLRDWRRVNVAFTRARSKLIIFGSRRTLRNNALLADFLALVDDRNWTMDLPPSADGLHEFDFDTQLTQNLLASAKVASSRLTEMSSSSLLAPSIFAVQQRKALHPLQNAGNRSLSSESRQNREKKIPKRVTGKRLCANERVKHVQEQMTFEVFEDFPDSFSLETEG